MYGISNKKSFDLNLNCKPDKLIEWKHTVSGFLVHNRNVILSATFFLITRI